MNTSLARGIADAWRRLRMANGGGRGQRLLAAFLLLLSVFATNT